MPLIAKQPPVRLIPLLPVDVAVQFKRRAETPALKVEVAVVEVA